MAGIVLWIKGFVRELRRRRVIRVIVVYCGTGFVALEAVDLLSQALELPGWTLSLVAVLLIAGFPVAVGLAWAYNITEEGFVQADAEGDRGQIGPGGKPFTSDAVIIGLLVLIAGLLLYPRLTGPAEQSLSEGVQEGAAAPEDTTTARLGPRSVGVLPFTYLAAEDSTDYFSIGMTDELITRLSQVEDLPVVARTSVMQYQGTEKTIPKIGRELGVAHVVEGSVQKAGGKVRIQAQLIDAKVGKHLWAEGFTRSFENVLDLQVDLARTIAGELKATLMPETKEQMARATQVDSTAYWLYLQARKLRFQETDESLTTATRLLQRSISIDSTFAPAWALLSFCARFGPADALPEKVRGIGRDSLPSVAAQRALAVDSTSAEAHVAMGVVREVVDSYFPAAGPHFKRAVELNPGLANAHREYGLYLSRMARFEAAEAYLRKAARLNPASAVAIRDLGWNDLWRENYEQAKGHFREALALQPDLQGARLDLGSVLLEQDSVEAALRQMRRLAEGDPGSQAGAYLGWAYAEAGKRDSTKALLSRIQEEYGSAPLTEAVLYAALGKPDRALDRIEQAGESPIASKVQPLFEPLRGTPRFRRILKDRGLDEATVQETMKKLDPDPPDVPTEQSERVSGEGLSP